MLQSQRKQLGCRKRGRWTHVCDPFAVSRTHLGWLQAVRGQGGGSQAAAGAGEPSTSGHVGRMGWGHLSIKDTQGREPQAGQKPLPCPDG